MRNQIKVLRLIDDEDEELSDMVEYDFSTLTGTSVVGWVQHGVFSGL